MGLSARVTISTARLAVSRAFRVRTKSAYHTVGIQCMVSSMLTEFDAWFGRAMMHPPIVWLCQRTGSSQYAIASYAWMLAAWTLIMRLTFNGFGEWVWAILIVVVALFETSFAATNPDRPRPSSAGLRMLVLVFVLIDLIQFAIHSEHNGFHGFNWGHAWDIFALIGEYAKTIRTIPPRKPSRAKSSTREAEA